MRKGGGGGGAVVEEGGAAVGEGDAVGAKGKVGGAQVAGAQVEGEGVDRVGGAAPEEKVKFKATKKKM